LYFGELHDNVLTRDGQPLQMSIGVWAGHSPPFTDRTCRRRPRRDRESSPSRSCPSRRLRPGFYYVHTERPFFGSLTDFISSGPIFPLVLEKDNAIPDLHKLMGATNSANAEEGTIRKKYAGSIEENAIHGSDGEDTAQFEIGYFFAGYELA
jgi:nucleoside diphosphate kinase